MRIYIHADIYGRLATTSPIASQMTSLNSIRYGLPYTSISDSLYETKAAKFFLLLFSRPYVVLDNNIGRLPRYSLSNLASEYSTALRRDDDLINSRYLECLVFSFFSFVVIIYKHIFCSSLSVSLTGLFVCSLSYLTCVRRRRSTKI